MENEPIEEMSERRISRRSMIKRTAGATAVFWAAPAITTLGSRAYAESPARCPGTDWNCGDTIEQCGTDGPLGLCVCDVDTEGRTFCWENFFCAGARACTDSDDCAGGYRWATTCGGRTCAPLCGAGLQGPSVTQDGPTAAG